jgi:hypothetical protein
VSVGGCCGFGQRVWWLRFAAHLRILRLTTRGLGRCRRAGLRCLLSQLIAQYQIVSEFSGC